jgi:hypothetical protein
MAELFVVSNPKRRRKKAHRRRKMTALQRKYFGKRRHKRRKTVHALHTRRNAHRRRRSSGKRRAVGYTVGSRPIRRRKMNPHSHHYRRRHRHNPSIRGVGRAVVPTIKAGAWGATGALMLDALWGLVYPRLGTFSTYLDNPYVGFAAKAVGSVVVGTVGGRVFRGKHQILAHGAMTVVAHDFMKSLLQQLAPGVFGAGGALPLGAYLSGSAPIVGTATIPQSYLPFSGVTPGDALGAYLSGSGSAPDSGVFQDDRTGLDPWNG